MNTDGLRLLLASLVGTRVRSVRRVLYVADGHVARESGPLEILVDPGGWWSFDAGGDGERLVVANERWTDPFEGPLTPGNREWVREHGKWTAFELTHEAAWASVIESVIDEVTIAGSPMGASKPVAAIVRTSSATVRIEVVADDLVVSLRSG